MADFLHAIVNHHSLKLSSPIDESIVHMGSISALNEFFDKIEFGYAELESSQYQIDNLLYGEIEFESFAIVLEIIKNKLGGLPETGTGTFYDIGSGLGKVVVSAALCYQWKQCIGIEIIDHFISISNQLPMKYSFLPNISFIKSDAFTYNYSDADVIFINSTMFSIESLHKICKSCQYMSSEGIIITTTQKLPNPTWTEVYSCYLPCSWGSTYFFIHKHQSDLPRFLSLHQLQLEKKSIPIDCWSLVHEAIISKSFNAGDVLELVQLVQEVAVEDGDCNDVSAKPIIAMQATACVKALSTVWLIDHSWTFLSIEEAAGCLKTVDGLRDRVLGLLDMDPEVAKADESLLSRLTERVDMYTLAQSESAGQTTEFFFLMDEVGAALTRPKCISTESANIRIETFFLGGR